MFDLDTRKANTKFIIDKTQKTLYSIYPDDVVNGFVIFLIHWIACAIPSLIILLGQINIYFYLSCGVWLIIFAAHFYFNGCIITRIERELWKDKNWYGPWVVPFKILESTGIEVTKNLAENIFICWGILIVMFVFLKILWKID